MMNAIAAHRPKAGRIFMVATTGVAGYEEFQELFLTGNEGNTRLFTTLKGLLDSGLVRNNGDDLILVAAGHTETIRTAGGLDTGTSAAGLTILGLGEQDSRALFTFEGVVGADFNIGSNGVGVENLRWDLTGVDNLTAPFDVNDSGFTFKNNDVLVADSGGQAALALLTDANAGSMKLIGNRFRGSDNAGTVAAVRIVGGDNIEILDNYMVGAYTSGVGGLEVLTTASTEMSIKGNYIRNFTTGSTRAISLAQGTSGVVVNNRLGILSGTTPIGTVTAGASEGLAVGGNYYTNATLVAAGVLL